jgi:hypothetical protein
MKRSPVPEDVEADDGEEEEESLLTDDGGRRCIRMCMKPRDDLKISQLNLTYSDHNANFL